MILCLMLFLLWCFNLLRSVKMQVLILIFLYPWRLALFEVFYQFSRNFLGVQRNKYDLWYLGERFWKYIFGIFGLWWQLIHHFCVYFCLDPWECSAWKTEVQHSCSQSKQYTNWTTLFISLEVKILFLF